MLNRGKVEIDESYYSNLARSYMLSQSKLRVNVTIGGNLALHAVELTRGELGHASVIGVVHEVVYTIGCQN